MPAPPCGDYGDVDDDGDVTIVDAMMISQYVAGTRVFTPDQLSRANVKGYGDVSIDDANLISEYVVGNITTFPVCSQTPVHDITFITIPAGAQVQVE